jgi:hypothetical protein
VFAFDIFGNCERPCFALDKLYEGGVADSASSTMPSWASWAGRSVRQAPRAVSLGAKGPRSIYNIRDAILAVTGARDIQRPSGGEGGGSMLMPPLPGN